MVEVKRYDMPVPKLVRLPDIGWRVISGHGFLVANVTRPVGCKVCPGARSCTLLVLNDKLSVRLWLHPTGQYKILKLDNSFSAKIETIDINTDFVGRYIPNIGLIVLTDTNGKILTPEDVADIAADYDEGEIVNQLMVKAYGMVAVNSRGKVDTVFNILKSDGKIYLEPVTKTVRIESRFLKPEIKVQGTDVYYTATELTKVDRRSCAVAVPLLKVYGQTDEQVKASGHLRIDYTRYCPYKPKEGSECIWSTDCYRFVLVARKNGDTALVDTKSCSQEGEQENETQDGNDSN